MAVTIRPAARAAAVLAAALLLGAAGPADSPVDVPEPAGLWMGAPNGYTPPAIAGARAIDPAALDALLAANPAPVLVDVAMADVKPVGFPAGRPWLPAHRSIPGSTWMPGAGAGALDTEHEALFAQRVADLTGGDKGRPVIVFCHPECWGSWNAAKRLVLLGYTGIRWFPDGVEGWQDRHDTTILKPDAAWTAKTATPDAQR